MTDKTIKRVVKFETPDGHLHDTHAQAQTHMSRANAVKELEDWIRGMNLGFESETADPDIILRNALVHNSQLLSKILGKIK